mmetsp:Transcript_16629/g.64931  ORF Transcript_16629/g.64931 Transcript_16629/m.64931 type:complete len:216 (+) Transcript_16629:2415-3062(+)
MSSMSSCSNLLAAVCSWSTTCCSARISCTRKFLSWMRRARLSPSSTIFSCSSAILSSSCCFCTDCTLTTSSSCFTSAEYSRSSSSLLPASVAVSFLSPSIFERMAERSARAWHTSGARSESVVSLSDAIARRLSSSASSLSFSSCRGPTVAACSRRRSCSSSTSSCNAASRSSSSSRLSISLSLSLSLSCFRCTRCRSRSFCCFGGRGIDRETVT